MSNTFLQIARAVAIKAGVQVQDTIFGNTSRTAVAIQQAIMDGTHKDVFRDADWSFLTVNHTFTTTGQKYYVLPVYVDRIVNNTIWDKTNSTRIIGPVAPEKWQFYYYGLSSPSVTSRICRIVGPARSLGHPDPDSTIDESMVESDAPPPQPPPPDRYLRRIQIHPDELSTTSNSAVDPITVAFLYINNHYIIHKDAFMQEWQSDDDTCLFDDDVVEAAALWRLLRILGMSYADEREEYNALVLERGSSDGGAETLSLLQNESMFAVNIPDTGFGS